MKTFKQFNEVAPPGFGHTKSDKDKGVKKGGTAAAFDRARKRGDFKGSKSDMFAIMWSQKNKGDKPHYKPGTDEKYKKYQEDWKPEIEVIDTKKRKKEAEKKRKEAEASLPPHLKLDVMKKAFSEEPERTPEYKAMQRKLYPRGESEKVEWRNPKNRGRKRKVMAEFEPELEMVDAEVVLEREDSPYEKASDKALDKKYGYGTSHDKGPKTGFGRASNRATAAAVLKDIRRRRRKSTSETRADAAHKGWSHTARTSADQTPEKKATRKKLADTPYKKLPKDEQEKDQVAADAVKKEYDKRKKTNESIGFEIDSGGHKKASRKAKLRNLAKGNTNPNEKAAAEKKAGGPKLMGEEEKLDKFDRYKRMIRHKQSKYGKGGPIGADYNLENERKAKGWKKKLNKEDINVEEGISTSDTKRLEKATVLSFSNDPKSVDRARARQVEVDYKDLMKQQKAKRKKSVKEETVDEAIERQAKDRKKLSQPHSVSGSRRDHSHDVDSALTDHVPRRGKGRVRPASKKEMRVSAMRDAGIKEEKKSCPEGEYYCFDMGKCRPIPKGHKVRKDGELVKENLLKKLVDREVRIMRHGGKSEEEVKKIKDDRREKAKKAMSKESVELHDANGNLSTEIIDIIKPEPMKVPDSPVKWKGLTEKVKLPAVNGSIICVYLTWRGRAISIKLFFPQSRTRRPTREEVNSQIQKVYPGAKISNFVESDPEPGEPFLQVGD